MTDDDLDARAGAMEEQGIPYKIISIMRTYLDEWEYDFQIVPASFHNKEKELEQAQFDAEVQWLAALSPEFLEANKESYLKEKLEFRGKKLEDYQMPQPPQPATLPDGTPVPEGMAPQPGMSPLDEGAQGLPITE